MREDWVSPEVVFKGRIFSVRAGSAILEDGTPVYREVVDHPGGVCVLPYDGRHVWLLRQYRIALGEAVLEAPAGKLEPGDIPAARAHAELREEVGLRAERLLEAGIVYGSVGFCSERIHLFIAADLDEIPAAPEEEERITIERYTLEEVEELLKNHAIADAKTAVLLHRLMAMAPAIYPSA